MSGTATLRKVAQDMAYFDGTNNGKILQAFISDLLDIIDIQNADIDKLQNDTVALDTAFDTLIAKLNADTGITDTDYAAAAAMTALGTTATLTSAIMVK